MRACFVAACTAAGWLASAMPPLLSSQKLTVCCPQLIQHIAQATHGGNRHAIHRQALYLPKVGRPIEQGPKLGVLATAEGGRKVRGLVGEARECELANRGHNAPLSSPHAQQHNSRYSLVRAHFGKWSAFSSVCLMRTSPERVAMTSSALGKACASFSMQQKTFEMKSVGAVVGVVSCCVNRYCHACRCCQEHCDPDALQGLGGCRGCAVVFRVTFHAVIARGGDLCQPKGKRAPPNITETMAASKQYLTTSWRAQTPQITTQSSSLRASRRGFLARPHSQLLFSSSQGHKVTIYHSIIANEQCQHTAATR